MSGSCYNTGLRERWQPLSTENKEKEGFEDDRSRRRRSRFLSEESELQSGLSNKAMVYLVIMALIVILCIVYVFQLRSARRGGNSADTAAVTADTSAAEVSGEPAAETSAEGAAETPAEASAEGEAEAPAEAPAEEAEQTPAE